MVIIPLFSRASQLCDPESSLRIDWRPINPADMAFAPLADLRAQLAAVININSSQQHSSHPNPHGYSNDVHAHASSSASPHDQNIDPSMGGPGGVGSGMMSVGALAAAGDDGDEDSLGDGRKGGKRELSQSKRAAQNRAAQVRGISFDIVMCVFVSVRLRFGKQVVKVSAMVALLCQLSCHPLT